jgi:outer membrane immunogenic protein
MMPDYRQMPVAEHFAVAILPPLDRNRRQGMGMKKFLLGTAMLSAAFAVSIGSSSAATLDDVLSELKSIRNENAAMRQEIATLRKNNPHATRQSAVPANAPSRSLPQNVSTAMAADLPNSRGYYKAMPVEGPYNWTGVYGGFNAGYAFGNDTRTSPIAGAGPGFPERTTGYEGFLGGVQLGYNWQWDKIVLGVEADVQGASIGGAAAVDTFTSPGFGTIVGTTTNKMDAFGTIRGRVGVAFDRVLVYGTGGYAAGRNTHSNALTGLVEFVPGQFVNLNQGFTEASIFQGWVAGGGIEYGFADRWSVKAEYLHLDFARKTAADRTTQIKLDFDLVRAGVNYRF